MKHPICILLLASLSFAGFGNASRGAESHSARVEDGFPSLDRVWAGADYVRAAEILASGKVPLPRLNDEKGRQFLERATAMENLAFQTNKKLPLAARFDESMTFTDGSKAILRQYLAATAKDPTLHTEVAMQVAFMLQGAKVMAELSEEFLLSIPRDEKYEVRMAGLKRLRLGMTQMFMGAQVSSLDRVFYSATDVVLILEAMAQVLPEFKSAFPAESRMELRRKLKSERQFIDGKAAELLDKMIRELDENSVGN